MPPPSDELNPTTTTTTTIHIDLHCVCSVPDSHAWLDLHDHPYSADVLPVVDLAAPDAASQLGQACEHWGAFQAIGHGIPTSLLDSLDCQVRRLFSLPAGQKMRAARSPLELSGYGVPPLSSFFVKKMWSEGFTVAGSTTDYARKLWPQQDPKQFCDVIEEYVKAVEVVARRLIRLMLRSLGINDESLPIVDEVSAVLQLNWYPSCPDPNRAMGLAAHTDSGLLAVLYQSSDVTGFQVLRPEDSSNPARWVPVPPFPGALLVNVGDLGHVLSNGRYRSVVHRAVVNRECPRLSAAYICGPAVDVKVSPVVGEGTAEAYRAVTWPEYRELKARLFDKALASIRVSEVGEDNLTAATQLGSLIAMV